MAAMARALGKSDAERPEDFLTALDALQKECSVDGLALSSFGMSPEEFPALTRNARETMGGLFAVSYTHLNKLIGTMARFTGLAIHQRVGKAAHMA